MSNVKYYVDESGNYLGGFDGTEPQGGVEVSLPPTHGSDTWNGSGWDAYAPTLSVEQQRKEAMQDGVEFEGVMCSAFKDDQFGLSSIKPYILDGMSFDFEFVNGSVLNINPSNIAAFEAVWFPFRLAHTKVNFQP